MNDNPFHFDNPENPLDKLDDIQRYKAALVYLYLARENISYAGSLLMHGNWKFYKQERILLDVIEALKENTKAINADLVRILRRTQDPEKRWYLPLNVEHVGQKYVCENGKVFDSLEELYDYCDVFEQEKENEK